MKRWEKGGKGKIGDEGKDALLTETTVPNKIKTFPALDQQVREYPSINYFIGLAFSICLSF